MATPEVIAEQQALAGINDDYETKFGFHDPETGYAFKAPKGLSKELVMQISEFKNEPQWMREFRLKALEHFLERPQPTWGSPMLAEVDYDQVREDFEKQGVIFMDMDSGLREHEDIVREYFASIIPANDNKLAALNSAVWSGGSFVYVPPGVHVEMPLQAYF